MKILNLGCGAKTSSSPDVINIDWSMYLRIKNSRFLSLLANLFLDKERKARLAERPNNVLAHNLKKGIPFPDSSVDAVYHSHVLEHIDRENVDSFLKECKRVLKVGGVIRVVVPDMRLLLEQYNKTFESAITDPSNSLAHEKSIADIIEQCVRKESHGSKFKPPLRRMFENLFLGGARERGETHQWMYDEVTLKFILESVGFVDVKKHCFNTSEIEGWVEYGLDANPDGTQYLTNSIYVEACKKFE